ncbi:VOC family protein [Weissella sagaensis]|uniref:VOC family protein n=1 Tax=Weissella sagaensis TaxID=2559928 RepID=UPI001EFF0816|nr:VOC family protein [Weissella sagaensis]
MKTARYDIQHLTIRVVDEKRTRVFYEKVLGLVDVASDETQINYAFHAGEAPFLTMLLGGKPQTVAQTGLYHMALLFPNAAELASILHRLLTLQIPVGAGDHDVSEAIYINDFEGNGIELYHDRDAQNWKWQDGFVTMGTNEVDGDKLLAQKQHDWTGFPTGIKIGHLHFMGSHLVDADKFFLKFLQMDLVSNVSTSAHFYSNNHYHHHHAVNLWQSENSDLRHLDEAGLIDWRVVVDQAYFDLLAQRAQSEEVTVSVNNDKQIKVIDPMGTTLLIMHD